MFSAQGLLLGFMREAISPSASSLSFIVSLGDDPHFLPLSQFSEALHTHVHVMYYHVYD